SPESAEMTKYVANALLATKISFINEMANLCERLGADVDAVRRGIGHDRRIGFAFLFPGVGYGGSCFPKDVRALEHLARRVGLEPQMLAAVDAVNERQKHVLVEKVEACFGDELSGKTIAVWGLAFKPKTDDIREAPALVLIEHLLKRGARVAVHDPEAMDNVRAIYGDRLAYAAAPMEALAGADALAINTEWDEYRNPNIAEMKRLMKSPTIFDGRNLYNPEAMREAGFAYDSIGRQPVKPDSATPSGDASPLAMNARR
ncbi:MAG: nucleotide sugar dehydrogenase, partial [Planctomycetes bacterium]|nr:nucleotide sugar dehydrogenase [Planctomycetota bacterium]